jgi:hypothetical protein
MLNSFLTKDDFPSPALATITSLVQTTLQGAEGPEAKWTAIFAEFDRGLLLNRTNIRTLADFLGNDTGTWIGKKIVVYTDPTVSFGGRTVGGIRVRAPKQAVQVKPTPAPAAPAGAFDDLDDDIPF